MKPHEIKIDPQLQNYLPRQDEQSLKALEKSLLDEGGARDAVIVWKEKKIMVDGHTRKAICDQHKLPYDIIEMPFKDISEVRLFMMEQQIARRNLSDIAMREIRGRYLEAMRKAGGAPGATAENSTASQAAKTFKVAAATIKRDANLAAGVSAIEEAKGVKVAQDIRAKVLPVRGGDLEEVGKAKTPEARAAAIEKTLAPKAAGKPRSAKESATEAPSPAPEGATTGQGDKALLGALRRFMRSKDAKAGLEAVEEMRLALGKMDSKKYEIPGWLKVEKKIPSSPAPKAVSTATK